MSHKAQVDWKDAKEMKKQRKSRQSSNRGMNNDERDESQLNYDEEAGETKMVKVNWKEKWKVSDEKVNTNRDGNKLASYFLSFSLFRVCFVLSVREQFSTLTEDSLIINRCCRQQVRKRDRKVSQSNRTTTVKSRDDTCKNEKRQNHHVILQVNKNRWE